MFLAGLKFVLDNIENNSNYVLVIKRKGSIGIKNCDFDRYSFGRISLLFCANCRLAKIIIKKQNSISHTYVQLLMRGNCAYPAIEIYSKTIDESVFAFSAYYFLYSIGLNVISIPGELKIVNNELCASYQNDGSKIVFFSKDENIYLHEFGSDKVFEFNNMISFSGYLENDIRSLLFNHGSRPFWSEKEMIRWMEFIDTIYIASILEV